MHDFRERLSFSEGVGLNADILEHIRQAIPSATHWEKATMQADKNGTDYWLFRSHDLPPLSFDMKNRDYCPIQKFGTDDACIEICSQFYRNRAGADGYWRGKTWIRGKRHNVGWTFDITKRTDWIVYTWPQAEGRRFWILPFPFLCQAARLHLNQWLARYPERPAENNGYETLNIFPLRTEISSAMRELMSGKVAGPPMMFTGAPVLGVQLPLY